MTGRIMDDHKNLFPRRARHLVPIAICASVTALFACFGVDVLFARADASEAKDIVDTPIMQYGYGLLNCAAMSPDGQHMATGGSDGNVHIWDLNTGGCLRTFGKHTGSVNSVAFSPDGTKVLTGSNDATARLWDASTLAQLAAADWSHATLFWTKLPEPSVTTSKVWVAPAESFTVMVPAPAWAG